MKLRLAEAAFLVAVVILMADVAGAVVVGLQPHVTPWLGSLLILGLFAGLAATLFAARCINRAEGARKLSQVPRHTPQFQAEAQREYERLTAAEIPAA